MAYVYKICPDCRRTDWHHVLCPSDDLPLAGASERYWDEVDHEYSTHRDSGEVDDHRRGHIRLDGLQTGAGGRDNNGDEV